MCTGQKCSNNCTVDEFWCFNSTRCIPFERKCDGIVDCPFQSDELHCGGWEREVEGGWVEMGGKGRVGMERWGWAGVGGGGCGWLEVGGGGWRWVGVGGGGWRWVEVGEDGGVGGNG